MGKPVNQTPARQSERASRDLRKGREPKALVGWQIEEKPNFKKFVDIVVDTNVLVAGLRSRNGASNALLHKIRYSNALVLHLSTAAVLEYEEVLLRFCRTRIWNRGQGGRMVWDGVYWTKLRMCRRSLVTNCRERLGRRSAGCRR